MNSSITRPNVPLEPLYGIKNKPMQISREPAVTLGGFVVQYVSKFQGNKQFGPNRL